MGDTDVDYRLKQLYDRIHHGFSLTLNDLVFLSRYDVDCYVKTYRHLVLEDERGKIEEIPIVKTSIPYTRYLSSLQQHIDLLINELKTRETKADLVVGLDGAEVLNLIEEPVRPQTKQVSDYQYFGSYEAPTLLNARA